MKAKKKKKVSFAGAGCLVQLVGLVLCALLFPWGIIPGVILLLVGGRMGPTVCSNCGNQVVQTSKLCPSCSAEF